MLKRHRRLRERKEIRDLVRETVLNPQDFIYPLFVVEGEGIKNEISSLDNCFHYSVDMLEEVIEEITSLKIRGVILFGVTDKKDEFGSFAYNKDGSVQRAVKKIIIYYTDNTFEEFQSNR